MTIKHPVLVYGTLRPGCGNYQWALRGRTVQEKDVNLDGFDMYSNHGFPFLIPGEGNVVATLIHVEEDAYTEVISDLDSLEGFHGEGSVTNLYDRILHTFEVDGEKVQAWLYIPEISVQQRVKATLPVVESGDWLNRF